MQMMNFLLFVVTNLSSLILLCFQRYSTQKKRNGETKSSQVLDTEHQSHILKAPQPQAKRPQEPPSIPTPAPKERTTIGSYNTPSCNRSRYGIHPPPIEATAYEIKISLVKKIQESKFLGTKMENPYEHLVSFERLCDTFRTAGVPQESIKLILFPFSLGERASQWERTLPSHLVKSWNDCRQLFLQKFYPIQRTGQVKRAILNFELGSHESFNDAWDRLKGYTKDCPHHGFEKREILSIFYGGVTKEHKWTLDVASKGSFLKLNVDQGELLVENLAISDGNYNEQLQVQDEEVDKSEEICYMQQQSTMTSPPGFPPLAPLPDFSGMFQQLLQGQAASTLDNAKRFATVQHNLHDLNSKVDTLASRVNHIESNHPYTSTVKTTGQLPGKAIQNPKEFCNAVFSDDLAAEDAQAIEDFCTLLDDTSVEELVFESDAAVSEDSDSHDGEDFSKSQEKTEQITLDLCIDHLDRPVDSGRAFSATEPEISVEKRSSFIPPPYKPQLPFPGRFKKKLIAESKALFDEHMKEIEAKMPLTEALKLIPESHKFLKDLVMARIKETQGMEVLSHECSAHIQSKVETEFTVDGQKVKPCMTDQIRLEETSVPPHEPPWT